MRCYKLAAPATRCLSERAARFTSTPDYSTDANRWVQPVFDDFNGTKVWQYAAGLDARLSAGLYTGTEFFSRDLDELVLDGGGHEFTADRDDKVFRAYFYWTPHQEWVISNAIELDIIHAELNPERVKTWSVPLTLLYFHPSGFFGGVGGTYVRQDVRAREGSPEGNDSFVTVDAELGHRLPKRSGVISVEVKNITDKRLKFEDDNFRAGGNAPIVSPFMPERTVLATLTLSF